MLCKLPLTEEKEVMLCFVTGCVPGWVMVISGQDQHVFKHHSSLMLSCVSFSLSPYSKQI